MSAAPDEVAWDLCSRRRNAIDQMYAIGCDVGSQSLKGVQVTLPQLMPAIVSGALLAFTFSFDDFIIAFFTSGQDQTVPIYLFASIRRGVSPAVNAIATVLLGVTILSMVVAGLVYRRGQRRTARPAGARR